MPPTEFPPDHRRVLVLKSDRFYAHAIQRIVKRFNPELRCTLAGRVVDADAALAAGGFELLLTGVELTDGDVFELLRSCTGEVRRVKRVLVITGRREPQILATLKALRVDGVFDPATEEPENLLRAFGEVMAGKTYWSESMRPQRWRRDAQRGTLCDQLTATERLVLAVIGDGCDDVEASARLGLREQTIKSVRRDLHRKLRVQHKGGLVMVAAQLGFVVVTPSAVIRPGLSAMLAAREARLKLRGETSEGIRGATNGARGVGSG